MNYELRISCISVIDAGLGKIPLDQLYKYFEGATESRFYNVDIIIITFAREEDKHKAMLKYV